jgi:diguanylate cyclase (GGDEF)-like protein
LETAPRQSASDDGIPGHRSRPFKSINDRFGHALGDRVLELFTDTARQSIRASDLIGRLGGEELAAVLTDTSRDKAVAVAERIREGFAQASQEVDGRGMRDSQHRAGAVGAGDVTELLAQADHAFTPERGRNRVKSPPRYDRDRTVRGDITSSVAAISAKSA